MMKFTDQLQHWSGEFGNEYTDRNVEESSRRLPVFLEILSGLRLDRVLEVGCNRGYNLVTISELLSDVDLFAIEPNSYALDIAGRSSPRAKVLPGNVFEIPFGEHVDLYLAAAGDVFRRIAAATEKDMIAEFLRGPVAHSGFRRLT